MAFEFIPAGVEVWLWTAGIAGVVGWLSHQSYCLRESRKKIWRLEKGFILSMKLTAKLTKRAHPNDKEIVHDADEIEEFVKIVLEDDTTTK